MQARNENRVTKRSEVTYRPWAISLESKQKKSSARMAAGALNCFLVQRARVRPRARVSRMVIILPANNRVSAGIEFLYRNSEPNGGLSVAAQQG